jgi:hypothetical protein
MARWDEIDSKVLLAVHELQDGTTLLDGSEVAARAGIDASEYRRSAEFLLDDGLIHGSANPAGILVRGVTPDGLRALREWPAGRTFAEAFPEVLNRLADQLEAKGDTEKSGLLKRGAEVLQGVSTAVISGVIKETLGL